MMREFIHDGPRDKRLETSAHQQIGLQSTGLVLILESQRIVRSRLDHIADIGSERHDPIAAAARYVQFHGDERRVLDPDTDLFRGRDQICPAIGILRRTVENRRTSAMRPIGVPM